MSSPKLQQEGKGRKSRSSNTGGSSPMSPPLSSPPLSSRSPDSRSEWDGSKGERGGDDTSTATGTTALTGEPSPASSVRSRKRSSKPSKGSGQGVRVVARVRPPNDREQKEGGVVCVEFPSEESIDLDTADRGLNTFSFDRVFSPTSTQQDVFEYVAKPIVADVMTGYNGTVFAYGQTSSGKTFTMEGPDIRHPLLAGVIPRTVGEIFRLVSDADDNMEFVIKTSYIEIYMEKIRDLLDKHGTKTNLPVREEKSRGVYVAGATEEYVTSEDELLDVMAMGASNRMVAATGMNQGSSRSHSVFIITVVQTDTDSGKTMTGCLYMVDLAGSEMVKKTHASGQVLEEAKTINKSLSALGLVINALTDGKNAHVPYRDSKLTRVLQNSLGGNSKTCLVINCSPSSFNASETLSTLRFGQRAKRIENKAVVNETRTVAELAKLLAKAESALELQMAYTATLEAQLKKRRGSHSNNDLETATAGVEAHGGESGESGPEGGQHTGEGGGQEKGKAADGQGKADDTPSEPGSDLEEGGAAAAALQQMAEKMAQLERELEEEQQESKRAHKETAKLSDMLSDKEAELSRVMEEAQAQCGALALQAEDAAGQASELQREIQGQRDRVREAEDKAKFDLTEMRLDVEKLSAENGRLAAELRMVTGDAVEQSNVGQQQQQQQESSSPLPPPPPPQTGTPTDTAAGAKWPADGGSKRQLLPDGVEVDAIVAELLKAKETEWQSEVEAFTEQLREASHSVSDARRDFERRLQDSEVQRSRLTKDVLLQQEKIQGQQKLLEELAAAPTGNEAHDKKLALFDKQNTSLRQRLEQLVAVHRQLLRKLAQMELDNKEFGKKVSLRDRRIAQLEDNKNAILANMDQLADNHNEEVKKLKEYITLQVPSFSGGSGGSGGGSGPHHQALQPTASFHGKRAIRGGTGAGQGSLVKTVRGGGGGGRRTSAAEGGTGAVHASRAGGGVSGAEQRAAAEEAATAAAKATESGASKGKKFFSKLGFFATGGGGSSSSSGGGSGTIRPSAI